MSHARINLCAALCIVPCMAFTGCGFAPGEADPAPLGTQHAPAPIRFVGDVAMVPQRGDVAQGVALGLSGHHVLFLNFEGVDVRFGMPGNPFENIGIRATDRAGLPTPATPVVSMDPFDPGNASRNDEILTIYKRVAGWYRDMNLDVVISRPLSGDYTMNIVGGHQSDIGLPDGVVGVSPGNCKHGQEALLDYSFSASLSQHINETAITVAHESGHAFGLAHTDNRTDIMFPAVSPMTQGFTGGTIPDQSGSCQDQLPGDMQDSHQTLIDNLGARDPGQPSLGGAPPKVRFLSPKDLSDAPAGTMTGSDLTLAVSAEAPQGLDHITLSMSKIEGDKVRGNHPVAELRPPQSVAKVRLSDAGEYLILATAYDRAGNITVAQSRIQAATPTCALPNDCAPGQKCQSGTCVTPPPPPPDMSSAGAGSRPYGAACESSAECAPDASTGGAGGICAITPVGQICTHYCNSQRLCAGHLDCVDGICLPPLVMTVTPKAGQLGAKCTREQDCSSGECSAASQTAPGYCTKLCDPDVAWTCPANMACAPSDGKSGMKDRCVTAAAMPAPQGGCSTGGSGKSGGPGGAGLIWGGLMLLVVRRRL